LGNFGAPPGILAAMGPTSKRREGRAGKGPTYKGKEGRGWGLLLRRDEKRRKKRGDGKGGGENAPNVKVSRITLHDSIVYNEQFTRNYSAALHAQYISAGRRTGYRASDLHATPKVAGSTQGRSAFRQQPWASCLHTHAHVPLSPISILWYRSMGGDAMRLGR